MSDSQELEAFTDVSENSDQEIDSLIEDAKNKIDS